MSEESVVGRKEEKDDQRRRDFVQHLSSMALVLLTRALAVCPLWSPCREANRANEPRAMALKLAHRRCADSAETPPDSAQGEMETILDLGDVGRQGQARDLDGERRDVPMGIEWVRCSRNKPSRSLASLGPLAYKVDLGAPVFTLSSPRRVYTYHRAPPALPSPSSSQLPLPSALSPRHAPPQSRPPTFFGPSCRSPFTRSARHAFPTQKSDSSASSTKSIPPSQLIALPSLSCSLSSLPQAKSIDGLSLHPTMLAQRNAESQAKVPLSPLSTTRPNN